MKFNPEIFHDYDIRGVYGVDFYPDFAFRLGAVFARFIGRTKFVVANDGRPFSHALARDVMEGITSMGGDVVYLGQASSPFFNFALNKLGGNGGIMVTASHNDSQYGGFKLFNEGGADIDWNGGLRKIKELMGEGEFQVSKYGGQTDESQAAVLRAEYVKFVEKESGVGGYDFGGLSVRLSGPDIVVSEARVLLEKYGIKEVQEGFDMAFAFDSDADRLLVFDKDDNRVRSDFIVGLLAKRESGFFSKTKLVYSLNFSKAVLEKLEDWGIKTYKTKIGRPHVREAMLEHRADLGGELSGHILFKNNNYSELPLMAMLLVLRLYSKAGKDMGRLTSQFAGWFNSGEINVDIEHSSEQMPELAKLLRSKFPDGKYDETDGITIEYSDPAGGRAGWWFNLRRSNTEPVLRLVVEAKTQEALDVRVNEITKLIGGQ